jgi:hypothetical protein
VIRQASRIFRDAQIVGDHRERFGIVPFRRAEQKPRSLDHRTSADLSGLAAILR